MTFLESLPLGGLLTALTVAAIIVWIAGVRIEAAVKALSTHYDLGSAFGGMVMLALASSLPELATTITGAVMGNSDLVTHNLLGGVMMQTAVLAAADAVFGAAPSPISLPTSNSSSAASP